MDELLSIIVLSYKNGELLYETLDSILRQDYPRIEIVICDDASPDFDADQVEDYIARNKGPNLSHGIVLVNPRNRGTVRNLNEGIRASHGAYLKFIAGDDTLTSPEVCTRQIAYLQNRPETALVVGNIVECDAQMNPVSTTGFLPGSGEDPLLRDRKKLLRYIVRENPAALATQAICFRRRFFEQCGLYDESFFLVEDLPMAVRIVESGEEIGYLNLPCVNHRGQVGVSTSNLAFDPGRLPYYRDLEKYYALSLKPVEEQVGRLYVRMRHGVMRFRIEFCQLEKPTAWARIRTVLKYAPHLLYYALTRMERVRFYLRKR